MYSKPPPSLTQACERFGVPLIGDAAESLGASHDLGMADSFGQASIISFNDNKVMTTSGGGMLLTRYFGLEKIWMTSGRTSGTMLV